MSTPTLPPVDLLSFDPVYLAALYQNYQQDPTSVDPSWQTYFDKLGGEAQHILGNADSVQWQDNKGSAFGSTIKFDHSSLANPNLTLASAVGTDNSFLTPQAILDSIQASKLIHAYRVRGHILANLDPLGLTIHESHPELEPSTYGFGSKDLDKPITVNTLGLQTTTVRELVKTLRSVYCGTLALESMHIESEEKREWLKQKFKESIHSSIPTEPEFQKWLLDNLIKAEGFEKFLQLKFPSAKRFGLEGGESLIPGLESLLHSAAQEGVEEVVIGMAHRGRLNVLANILEKPYASIFAEFQGMSPFPEETPGSGDVKYHLGASTDKMYGGRSLHLSLTPNPSHLEAVNTVVLGKVRAKMRQRRDESGDKTMGILIHGDAAFAGQGIVLETLLLSKLPGYQTGGTIHFVINNQVGFTTNPQFSRSSRYCTDIAKTVQAPIFHVNGDDVEAVAKALRIALQYRQTFKEDVVIDMWCYRRHGHNEMDEPNFTQPEMYDVIKRHPTTLTLYCQHLESISSSLGKEAKTKIAAHQELLQQAFAISKTYKLQKADWLDGTWNNFDPTKDKRQETATAVPLEFLQEVGKAITTQPGSTFKLNSKIARQLEQKKVMFDQGTGIDWGTAEALAFGTLVCEGATVRLSGQDSGRGTFSHRHSVWVDQTSSQAYLPLNNIRPQQARFEVIDSPLSEFGVLGFEYGHSIADPHTLVIWEAQFGDFANGAQVIMDQFISSAETKWLRLSGLVMLLPHGYEGQGPEHSSARLERYLQLCAEDNMQIANCTTPANYFHIIRRQMHRNFRKPLVLMTPKSLLRHKEAVSNLKEMGPETAFLPVINDPTPQPHTKRVILCSGKVYYDLATQREAQNIKDVAILRIEQLYPFPKEAIIQSLEMYRNAEIIWCQEEPQNMGAWSFIAPRVTQLLKDHNFVHSNIKYIGRAAGASPATGSHHRHEEEQHALVQQSLEV